MLKRFSVTNYKNFDKTLVLDLGKVGGYKFNVECIQDNIITKCLIYGRNATGKTNFGEALTDIWNNIFSRPLRLRNNRILNANSNEKTATFSYEFIFGNDEVDYEYQRNLKQDLVTERLAINGNIVFDMNFEKGVFSDINLELVDADTIQIEKYLETVKHMLVEMEDEEHTQVPFLRYILNNVPIMPRSILNKLEDYVKRMRISIVSNSIRQRSLVNISFNEYLAQADNLKKFQDFLNGMGIECNLEVMKTVDGQYELFFKHKSRIPFYENASSGTLTLTTFYRRVLAVDRKPSLFYMDEFDAFYNYEISEKIVRYLKKNFPESQFILTTHNTNLMTNQLMRPDCLFILSKAGKITPLCDATERELREGHNLEKLYIGGEFEQYE